MQKRLLILLAAVALVAFPAWGAEWGAEKTKSGKTAVETTLDAGVEVTIDADVVYGHKDGMALTYDVFQPTKPNGAGVLYMVSGGWFSIWQPPEQRVNYLAPLLSEGFTVFAIHHGSAPRFKVPEAVSDVRAAVRHVHKRAQQYGVDSRRLGVWGGSAGGHLSLMLGLNPEGEPTFAMENARRIANKYAVSANDDARIAAIVAYYPPTDLRQIIGPNKRFPALDFDRAQGPSVSPILFVTEDDPPTLLIHGTDDELVRIRQSQNLKAELEAKGVVHDLLVIEGGTHGFRDPKHRAQARAALIAWFKTHLAP